MYGRKWEIRSGSGIYMARKWEIRNGRWNIYRVGSGRSGAEARYIGL